MNHIIIDLEMNTSSKDSEMKNEIIEIGAVKLNDDFHEISRFHTYSHPENGEITEIITSLTGIKQYDVENAPLFHESMDSFIKWAGEGDFIVYSWSNCDKKQIEYEAAYKKYFHERLDYIKKNWVDLQDEYDKVIGTSHSVALDNALKSAGVEVIGVPHTALGDAINTAELFKILRNEDLKKEKLGNLIELFKQKNITNSLMDLFPEMVNYLVVEDLESKEE